MEDVFKMFAMSNGEENAKPPQLDSDHGDFEEDEEFETSNCSPPRTMTRELLKRR